MHHKIQIIRWTRLGWTEEVRKYQRPKISLRNSLFFWFRSLRTRYAAAPSDGLSRALVDGHYPQPCAPLGQGLAFGAKSSWKFWMRPQQFDARWIMEITQSMGRDRHLSVNSAHQVFITVWDYLYFFFDIKKKIETWFNLTRKQTGFVTLD